MPSATLLYLFPSIGICKFNSASCGACNFTPDGHIFVIIIPQTEMVLIFLNSNFHFKKTTELYKITKGRFQVRNLSCGNTDICLSFNSSLDLTSINALCQPQVYH